MYNFKRYDHLIYCRYLKSLKQRINRTAHCIYRAQFCLFYNAPHMLHTYFGELYFCSVILLSTICPIGASHRLNLPHILTWPKPQKIKTFFTFSIQRNRRKPEPPVKALLPVDTALLCFLPLIVFCSRNLHYVNISFWCRWNQV